MFYVSDGKVYVREGNHFRNVGFTVCRLVCMKTIISMNSY